jgi:hypothetical protein
MTLPKHDEQFPSHCDDCRTYHTPNDGCDGQAEEEDGTIDVRFLTV